MPIVNVMKEKEMQNAYIGEVWNGDLSKATQIQTKSLSGAIVYSIYFSDDGKNLYYGTYNGDRNTGSIRQRKLSTPRDISSMEATDYTSFSIGSAAKYGVYPTSTFVMDNGNYLYVNYADTSWHLETYQLSIPYDISTKSLVSQITGVDGFVYMSKDGTKIWYTNASNGTNYKELTVPYVVEFTGTKVCETDLKHLYFSSDGQYVYSDSGATIIQYLLSTPFDIGTLTQVATLNTTNGSGASIFDTYGDNLYKAYGTLNNYGIIQYGIS